MRLWRAFGCNYISWLRQCTTYLLGLCAGPFHAFIPSNPPDIRSCPPALDSFFFFLFDGTTPQFTQSLYLGGLLLGTVGDIDNFQG